MDFKHDSEYPKILIFKKDISNKTASGERADNNNERPPDTKKEVQMDPINQRDTPYPYIRFSDRMLEKGKIYWIENPLNQKESRTTNIYLETCQGLKPYPGCYNDAQKILDSLQIERLSERDYYYKRFINENKLSDMLNSNTNHLIATPNGKVLDFDILSKLITEKQDPKELSAQWRRSITEEEYQPHYITLRSGVDYPENANPQRGKDLLEKFFRLSLHVQNEVMFQETFQWILGFMGRLLLGKNSWKEFVVFAGEKDSGKTTFARLLEEVLGSYAGIVSDTVLYNKDTAPINRELYRLKDKRLIIHSEGSGKREINTQTLKKITGDSSFSLESSASSISFTINGKIIEDTNYIPSPDIKDDEAFDTRLVVIPFMRNRQKPQAEIDHIIKELYAGKEDIFSLMVHNAIENMGSVQKTQPGCSDMVKYYLSIIRNPIKFFYATYCEKSYENNTITAKDLFGIYREWVSEFSKTGIGMVPYLQSELPINIGTDLSFNAQMKNLHPHINPHSRDGFIYTHIEVRRDRLFWGTALEFKEDPLKQAKLNALSQMEDIKNKAETVTTIETHQKNIDNELSINQEIIANANNTPGSSVNETTQYMYNPYAMPQIYDNIRKQREMAVWQDLFARKEAFRRQQESQIFTPAKDDYVLREYPKDYFACKDDNVLNSYKNGVTPYDLPKEGGTKKPDNLITPFDMDPEKE
jgi:energy-coupling factor transporter ATP-binding protein EcfA2